jgi:hypothetical protein
MIKILILVGALIVLILLGTRFLGSNKNVVVGNTELLPENKIPAPDYATKDTSKFADESGANIELNLSFSEEKEEAETNQETTSGQGKLKITDTPTGWLNVRGKPSVLDKTLGKVYPDEEYVFEAEKDGWYYIVIPKGIDGWISGEYVEEIQN